MLAVILKLIFITIIINYYCIVTIQSLLHCNNDTVYCQLVCQYIIIKDFSKERY